MKIATVANQLASCVDGAPKIFVDYLCIDNDRRTVMCDQKFHPVLGKASTINIVYLFA